VCLLYDHLLHSHLIRLPACPSFEFVAVYHSGFNAVVVVIYRCSPCARGCHLQVWSMCSCVLLRLQRSTRMAGYVLIVGDFNIHVDEVHNSDTGKLSDILISLLLILQHIAKDTRSNCSSLETGSVWSWCRLTHRCSVWPRVRHHRGLLLWNAVNVRCATQPPKVEAC